MRWLGHCQEERETQTVTLREREREREARTLRRTLTIPKVLRLDHVVIADIADLWNITISRKPYAYSFFKKFETFFFFLFLLGAERPQILREWQTFGQFLKVFSQCRYNLNRRCPDFCSFWFEMLLSCRTNARIEEF